MTPERRPVRNSAILVYTIGRTQLLELLHTEMQNDQVKFVEGEMSGSALLNSLRTLKPKCARPVLLIPARRANTTILAYHAPCWPGRHAIRTFRGGLGSLKGHASSASQDSPTAGAHLCEHDLMRGSTPGHVKSRLQTLLPRSFERLPVHWAGNVMLPLLGFSVSLPT